MKREWWEPQPTDAAWLARLRSDYEDKAGWSDEQLMDYFNEYGRKYAVTWDHVGDAYEQFEALADAYLKLRAASTSTAAQAQGGSTTSEAAVAPMK